MTTEQRRLGVLNIRANTPRSADAIARFCGGETTPSSPMVDVYDVPLVEAIGLRKKAEGFGAEGDAYWQPYDNGDGVRIDGAGRQY